MLSLAKFSGLVARSIAKFWEATSIWKMATATSLKHLINSASRWTLSIWMIYLHKRPSMSLMSKSLWAALSWEPQACTQQFHWNSKKMARMSMSSLMFQLRYVMTKIPLQCSLHSIQKIRQICPSSSGSRC